MNHGSLFTGVGIFDLAAQEAGLKNVFQVEKDKWCQKILEQNFPVTDKYLDINDFNATKYKGTIDVISGGFPCQDISISGRGEGIFGARSGMWMQFSRVISEVLPRYVIIENSSQITRKGFEKVLYDLSRFGYDAEWESFFASEFGKYHHRKRTFILAYPKVQRRRGFLHYIKRSLLEKNKKTYALDTQCNPFLQFEKMYSEPAVFRVDDGIAKRLDVIKRLGACGNGVVKDIPLEIFKIINNEEQINQTIKQKT